MQASCGAVLGALAMAAAADWPTARAVQETPSIFTYNLSYTNTDLSSEDSFEHTLLVSALSGLANRDGPRLYTPYMPADDQWMTILTQNGAWLSNATFTEVPSGGNDLWNLVQTVRSSWAGGNDLIQGLVLYDPAVPATSNLASTAAGVEGLLPVSYRNSTTNDTFPTAYEQLVDHLPVVLDLTIQGFEGGPRTGSAKGDAYLWALERYIIPDAKNPAQQLADPTLIAYYVDYFGATLHPAAPQRPTPPAPAKGSKLLQDEALVSGSSLLSPSETFRLDMQSDGNLVLYNITGANQNVVWASNTSSMNGGTLELNKVGELFIMDPTVGTKLWSSQSGAVSTGSSFSAAVQDEGDFVIYNNDAIVWSTNASAAHRAWAEKVSDDDLVQTKATNHDYFVAHKAFFFDLSVWDDEVPNDEPWQVVGSDKATFGNMLEVLEAAATAQSGYETAMIHMGGFVPWHYKYVKDGICGPGCKHEGVETEWATMLLLSQYNVFADADACCTVGTMANSALWQHHPLPDKLTQKFTPPTVEELQQRGLVQSDGKTVTPKAYAAYYAGDYDSAAWVYNKLLDLFDDGGRGDTPIGWAVDPELSLRFPPIFQHLYDAATENDVFISGDSGAGYLNPSVLPDNGTAWGKWNQEWFDKFDLNFTGFVINGDAGTMTAEAEAVYAAFSPAGIVYTPTIDPRGTNNTGGVTADGVPVMHHIADLPIGISLSDALSSVSGFADSQKQSPATPFFAVFRTILQPASFHHTVATKSAAASDNVEWVDPVTMGILVKLAQQSKAPSPLA